MCGSHSTHSLVGIYFPCVLVTSLQLRYVAHVENVQPQRDAKVVEGEFLLDSGVDDMDVIQAELVFVDDLDASETGDSGASAREFDANGSTAG
mgnify:CR=1 FL=1